jgi:hypothetical protein
MVCSPYFRCEGHEADEQGDCDAHPDLGGGVLEPGEEGVQLYAAACAAEGHAGRGHHGTEDPEGDDVAGGPALGCGEEQRQQGDRTKFPSGRTRDRQLAENGLQLAQVGKDGDDEPEGRGGQGDGEKERIADPPHGVEGGTRDSPEQQRAGIAPSGAPN